MYATSLEIMLTSAFAGLPREPSAYNIDVNPEGRITGLF
jgi:formyltetrahydrofolate synthetase